MNPFIGVALFLVLAALQSSLAHVLAPLPGARPHIVVLAAISCGLLYGPRSGALWGTIGGFALDLASAAPVGANTLPLAIVGFLGGFGEYAAFRVNRLLPLQAAFAGAIVFDLLHMILLQLSGWDFNVIVAIYEVVLPSALISLPGMPVVYGLFLWLRRRSRTRPEIGW